MSPITLYHSPYSAPSRGVVWVSRYLGIDLNIKILNLIAKEQLTPDYLKINPQHCVPTLVEDDFVLWESRAIAEYLVDTKAPGHSIHPTDLKLRTRINQRLYFDLGTLYTRIRAITFPIIHLGATKIPDDKRASMLKAFEFLNQFLEGSTWLVDGTEPTMADFFTASSLSSVIHSGASMDAYPNIVTWLNRCRLLKGFEEMNEGAKLYGSRVRETLVDKF